MTVLLALTSSGAYFWLQSTLPDYQRELESDALFSAVIISRDGAGVPHIRARSMHDAAIGMGYVQAQDRFWQMSLMRLAVAGRLSEVFGATLLPADVNYRIRAQLPQVARRSDERLDPESRKLFQAFADGVNLAITSGEAMRSPEWTLAGMDPEPWTASDINNAFTLFAETASGGDRELWQARLDDALPASMRELFLQPLPKAYPTLYGDAENSPTLPGGVPDQPSPRGTNFFLFGPQRTSSGAPILAVDPHLPIQAPSLIYPLRLSLPDEEIAGGAWIGTPAVAFGQNRHIAWGMTHLFADTVDYVVERIDPQAPEFYLTPEGREPFAYDTERFVLRGGAVREIAVRRTHNGVIISDDFLAQAGAPPGMNDRFSIVEDRFGRGHVVARKDIASTAGSTTIKALLELSQARSWLEFRQALRAYEWTNNVAFADRTGNIGVQMAARLPRRSASGDWRGQRLARAWRGEGEWEGYVPYDDLPNIYNPLQGVIADSNSRAVGPGNLFRVGDSFAPPWRVVRAKALMAARERHDLDSVAAMQLDVYSGAAAYLLPRLHNLPLRDGIASDALELLRPWDYRMSLDAPEPLLYAALAAALQERLINVWGPAASRRHAQAMLLGRILDAGDPACDHPATISTESCTEAVSAAIEKAVAVLSAAHGSDMRSWRWREEHRASFEAIYSWDNIPWLGTRLRTRVATPGGQSVLNQGSMQRKDVSPDNLLEGLNFEHTYGATFRLIADLGDRSRSRWSFSPGISGNIASSHWDDQVEGWARGEYRPLFEEPARDAPTTVLRPRLAAH
ncbi:MAG: penicillin acylase family protein [Pseudomonadota bacterium]